MECHTAYFINHQTYAEGCNLISNRMYGNGDSWRAIYISASLAWFCGHFLLPNMEWSAWKESTSSNEGNSSCRKAKNLYIFENIIMISGVQGGKEGKRETQKHESWKLGGSGKGKINVACIADMEMLEAWNKTFYRITFQCHHRQASCWHFVDKT